MNTPKELSKFEGEFVVFFSEDKDPSVLFHSLIAEDAFLKAEEIKKTNQKNPVVIRVPMSSNTNTSNILGFYCNNVG